MQLIGDVGLVVEPHDAHVAGAVEATASAADGPVLADLRRQALAIAKALEAAEGELTALDAKAGDGDLGASLARGAAAIRALPDASFGAADRLLADLGNALRRAVAGSSGPFYATALLRAAARLRDTPAPRAKDWVEAFAAGIAAITELGGAKAGDRTMVDALLPALEAARRGEDFARIAAAAAAGAEATRDMFPALGRASYLGERALGTPDGGAVAVAIWLRALAEGDGQ